MSAPSGIVGFLLCSIASVAVWPTDALAQRVARHGLTAAQYQQEFDRWAKQGYRLTQVSGYTIADQDRYAAIWVKSAGPPWVARHGMTGAQYQQEFDKWVKQGYRLVHISGYGAANQDRYAAVWEQRAGPAWVARHGMTAAQYQAEVDKRAQEGFRLTLVEGYGLGNQERYAAIWEKGAVQAMVARHGMSPAQYQQEFDKWVKQGYRLAHISGYGVGNAERYAAIWVKGGSPAWRARHGMSGENYQSEAENHHYAGYRLAKVSAFAVANQPRFAAIWEGGGLSGADDALIAESVRVFMQRYGVPGLALAIARDGRLVYAHGFGVSDKARGWRTSPMHKFRLASVSKPITAVAIMKLYETRKLRSCPGKVRLCDKVFGSGAILGTTYGTQPYGKYIADITVQHLLEHAVADWDALKIDFNLDHPEHIGKTLDASKIGAAPGGTYKYSNFGYRVLGRVIERLSGLSYEGYVRAAVLKPAGIQGMTIARKQRQAGEVTYYGKDDRDPYNFDISKMDSHGGWIASPIDLVRFLVRVDGFATKPDILLPATIAVMATPSSANAGYAMGWQVDGAQNRWHGGSLPGTETKLMRASNGFAWAVLLNTSYCCNNDKAPKSFGADLDRMMSAIMNGVKSWPAYDLF